MNASALFMMPELDTSSRRGLKRSVRAVRSLRIVMANESGYWLGVDGNLSNTANWATTEGGAGGQPVPNGSGSAYFRRGSVSITSGSLSCANIYVGEGFGGDASRISIGTDSSSISMAASTLMRVSNSRLSLMRITGTQGVVELPELGGGSFLLTGGSATSIFAGSNGYIELADDVELTFLMTDGAECYILGDSTSPIDLMVAIGLGARAEIKRVVAGGIVDGRLLMSGDASQTNTAGNNIQVSATGVLDLQCSGGLAGRVTVMSGGELNGLQAPYPITLAEVYAGASAKLKYVPAAAGGMLTVTSLKGAGKITGK